MGALDVCPFVPVAGVTMDDCVRCSREFGRRLGEELHVPVFLYEASAHGAALHRRTLPQIREGEYEQLPSKVRLTSDLQFQKPSVANRLSAFLLLAAEC